MRVSPIGLILFGLSVHAQTTQGLILGRVVDSITGSGVPQAAITCTSEATTLTSMVQTNANGNYVMASLSPGRYVVTVTSRQYQAQQARALDLPVAGRIELNFRLRPLYDVWEAGQFRSRLLPASQQSVGYYGPDVDTSRVAIFNANRGSVAPLETSVSEVISSIAIQNLPLSGRDVYTMLLLLPGVTSDTTTARGLGFSVNGQRPSSSNYLLDGLENNNSLTTGPLTAVAPEGVQEYRISTNNFSAEYGGTSGFLANVITRSGGNRWHGLAYFYTKNDALNANDFRQNLAGEPRTPLKELQPGLYLGGPLKKPRLFGSVSFEYFRFRSRSEPQTVELPSTTFLNYCVEMWGGCTSPQSLARRLLQQYPAPAAVNPGAPTADVIVSPTSSVNRYLATPRVDYVSAGGQYRVMGRVAVANYHQPDAVWSPYEDFLSPLNQSSASVATNVTAELRPNVISETKLVWRSANLRLDRPHPEVPTLFAGNILLPGSPSLYSLGNADRGAEFVTNLLWTVGRHVTKAGGGTILRHVDAHFTVAQEGYFSFPDIKAFGIDSPDRFFVTVSRAELQQQAGGPLSLKTPNLDRSSSSNSYFGFIQDTFRANKDLVLNYGLRYDFAGAAVNVGAAKDGLLQLGSGSSLAQRLESAVVRFPGQGDQPLYPSDAKQLGVRLGFSYGFRDDGRLLLRGGYGIFYDRIFDNLWQTIRNNDIIFTLQPLNSPTNYLAPIGTLLGSLEHLTPAEIDNTQFVHITLFQPDLKAGHAHSYFVGMQDQLFRNMTVEVNALGSLGRELITSDLINRALSKAPGVDRNNLLGFSNPQLPLISFRANQGSSNYNAMTALARYRGSRTQFQIAYTWSHSIDNQDESLAGEFDFTQLNRGDIGLKGISAFSRQFDPASDRGNSDFDQRHNLVFYLIWESPSFPASRFARLIRDWKLSTLGAFRSGFPYTVSAPAQFSFTGESIANNRADIVNPLSTTSNLSYPGGRVLLNLGGFSEPLPGTLGNSGRNAFRGPGFYSVDLSAARSIPVRRLGEGGRLVLRADAINVLNHANLNTPVADVGSPDTFGVALYGRQEQNRGFPLLTPLRESGRQIQLLLRIEF